MEQCPLCGSDLVCVVSLATWIIDDNYERVPAGEFQPDDLDAAYCTADECEWEGDYSELET